MEGARCPHGQILQGTSIHSCAQLASATANGCRLLRWGLLHSVGKGLQPWNCGLGSGSMKWFLWALLLISPSAMSVEKSYGMDTAIGVPIALTLVGLGIVFKFNVTQDVAAAAVAGLAGGLTGFVVGVVIGVIQGYWWGVLYSSLMCLAAVSVVAACRRTRPDLPLVRGL